MVKAVLITMVFLLASCSYEPQPSAAAEEAATPPQQAVKPVETRAEPAAEQQVKPEPASQAEPEKKPEPVRVKKPVPKEPTALQVTGKHVIGGVESIRAIPGDIVLDARIDTGAKSSSMHAEGILEFERDGKRWVRFTISDGKKSEVVEKRVVRRVRIKQQDAPYERRPVVMMRLIVGEVSQSVEVTLTDRSNFQYKALVGRNFLHDLFIVDVSRKKTSQPLPYRR